MKQLVRERRQHFGHDLLSELIRVEEDGERFSADELIAQVCGLLAAGFEPTIGLIGNGVRNLIYHPEQRRLIASNQSLVDPARRVSFLLRPTFSR